MRVTRKDYNTLVQTQMEWAANKGWQDEQEFRFDEGINWDFKFVYWFKDYTDALLASFFLMDAQWEYEISFDQGSDTWVIITDFPSDWKI